MNKLAGFKDVQTLINEIRKLNKGFLTNYYPDPAKAELWCDYELFFTESCGGVTFLLRKDDGFYHLYYISTAAFDLYSGLKLLLKQYPETIFSVDVIGNEKEAFKNGEVFHSAGFTPYTKLVRMSRLLTDSGTEVPVRKTGLKEATTGDLNEINRLLHEFFDPLAENLPLLPEIESWINSGQVLVFCGEQRIHGFLIYEIIGYTSYLRYWFVHPEYRELKIGSILIQEFFRRCAKTRRQLFWVISSNENAIKRYRHYGFLPENLIDNIYTNKEIHYGENNH